MKVYNPSDIAELLNVKESTLRKYCLLLEDVGVSFQRNNRGQRWYSDNDVILLRKFMTLKNNGDMSLKECAEATSLWNKGGSVSLPSTDTHGADERYKEELGELKDMVKNQSVLINGLTERLDEQEQYIKKSIHDRDMKLLQSIDEIIESKKQIAAPEKERKGFFARMFGK